VLSWTQLWGCPKQDAHMTAWKMGKSKHPPSFFLLWPSQRGLAGLIFSSVLKSVVIPVDLQLEQVNHRVSFLKPDDSNEMAMLMELAPLQTTPHEHFLKN